MKLRYKPSCQSQKRQHLGRVDLHYTSSRHNGGPDLALFRIDKEEETSLLLQALAEGYDERTFFNDLASQLFYCDHLFETDDRE
jgi:hypothetical protein